MIYLSLPMRKLIVYREAGVSEYWVIEGEHKTLTVYLFESEKTHAYGEKDSVPVTTLKGLSIDLAPVFAE